MVSMTYIVTLVLFSICALAENGLPRATLASGIVIGTTTSIASATATVNKFLGIPFAAPPKRFSPPAQPLPWKRLLNVSVWSPACIQQVNYPEARRNLTELLFDNPQPVESEDCLYLNVYAPSTAPPSDNYAVLFWIFGGSLELGTAGQPIYDGSYFAAFEDVIVVSANYRTNVFGFPNSPEIPVTQRNLGFLDQRFALQWVQDNIRSFGGNPKKVTVFGESAGATSTDNLVTSWPHNPPFRPAILESGQASLPSISYIGVNSTENWVQLAAALNCSHAVSNLTYIRAASATTIKSILEHTNLQFCPVIDNFTYIQNAITARAAHNIANVPIMAGTNGQEGRVFVIGQNNITAFVQSTFGKYPELAASVAKAYPIGDFGTTNDYEVISQIYTDVLATCPQAIMVNQSAAAGYPTWRYYYNATFANQQVLPDIAAFHSSEIVQVFSTYAANFTAQQVALSNYMRGAWARFAKNPMAGPGWNAIGTFDGTDLGILGTNGSSGVQVIRRDIVDVNCGLFAPLYAAANAAALKTGERG